MDDNKNIIDLTDLQEIDLFADELDERLNAGTVSSTTCVSSASSATSCASSLCTTSTLCSGGGASEAVAAPISIAP